MLFSVFLGGVYLFLTALLGYNIFRKYTSIKKLFALSLGFLLVNFIIPFIAFSLAILLKTNINHFTVFGSVILLSLFSILNNKKVKKLAISGKEITLMFFSIIIFLIFFMNYSGPFLGYWDTYISSPAIIMTGNNVDFVDVNNNLLYEYELQNQLPDDLVNKEAYGIISKDQRLGTGIVFSIPFLFFGLFGFRLYYALFVMFGFILLYGLINTLIKNKTLSLITSIFMFLNGYVLGINTLNPNLLGMILTIIMIYLLVQKKHNWVILGLTYGIYGSLRNTALLFGLAIGFILLREKDFFKKTLIFSSICVLVLIPTLYWNNYAFGNYLIHSSQYSDFEGHRPEFTHSLFGHEFKFNGLFNYPLHTEIVRTPHYAFPVFLYLPLLLIKIFGMFTPFVIYGLFKKLNKKFLLLLWFLPFMLFLLFQENWEVAKTTFILLVLPILFIFMGSGINHVFKNKKHLWKILTIFVLIIITMNIARKVDVPVDERWYQRFPKAYNNTYHKAYEGIEHKDLKFFQSQETQQEIELQKNELTTIPIIPYFTNFKFVSYEHLINELSKDNIRPLAIWRYIYG